MRKAASRTQRATMWWVQLQTVGAGKFSTAQQPYSCCVSSVQHDALGGGSLHGNMFELENFGAYPMDIGHDTTTGL